MNINLDIHGSKDIIYVNQNDTSEGVTFYIKDNGTAVDLTGLTVYFILKKTSYITTQLLVVSASSGTTSLTLTSAMVATSGTIVFEVVGTTANDETAFRISSYMVVQNVYSGDDGPNADDEVNPGIDVLYGEDVPDDEDDGEDKDFYLKLGNENGSYVISDSDYQVIEDAQHPISLSNFTRNANNEFSYVISGNPSNDGEGETLWFPLHNCIIGETYTCSFKLQFGSGATFPYTSESDYIDLCGTTIVFNTDTSEHTYTTQFTYTENGEARFKFYRIKDNTPFTATITEFKIVGDFQEDFCEIYNKKDGTWRVYNPPEMKGATSLADGFKGVVPTPTISDRDKVLKGDGTWGVAGTAVEVNPSGSATATMEKISVDGTVYDLDAKSAVSKLTDVELTSLSNGQLLKYNSSTQKWENSTGGGGSSSLQFDDTERVVGTWFGKPLYQKTITLSDVSFTGSYGGFARYSYNYNSDFPTAKMMWADIDMSYIIELYQGVEYYRSMAFYEVETDANQSERYLQLFHRGAYSNINIKLTLLYTKTTD